MLFTEITGNLNSGRGHSSIFVMNEAGDILYHPLVPGNFQSPVSVTSIESRDVLESLKRLAIVLRLTSRFSTIASGVLPIKIPQ